MCGVANEFAGEASKNRVGIPDIDSLINAAPLNFERHGARNGRRPAAKYRIDEGAIIENRHVSRLECGAATPRLDVHAALTIVADLDRPKQPERRKGARVEVMNLCAALTGLVDVDSYERECRLVDASVGTAEIALHEPHIRIQEGVARLLTAGDIGLGHHSTDVPQADEAVHVGDGDRLGIDGVKRSRAENVICAAKNWGSTWNGNRSEGGFWIRYRRPP